MIENANTGASDSEPGVLLCRVRVQVPAPGVQVIVYAQTVPPEIWLKITVSVAAIAVFVDDPEVTLVSAASAALFQVSVPHTLEIVGNAVVLLVSWVAVPPAPVAYPIFAVALDEVTAPV